MELRRLPTPLNRLKRLKRLKWLKMLARLVGLVGLIGRLEPVRLKDLTVLLFPAKLVYLQWG